MDFIASPGLYVYRTLRRKLQLSLIEQFYKRAFTEQVVKPLCKYESFLIDTNGYSRYPFRRIRRPEKPAFQRRILVHRCYYIRLCKVLPRKIDRQSPVLESTCPLLASVSPVKPNTPVAAASVFGALPAFGIIEDGAGCNAALDWLPDLTMNPGGELGLVVRGFLALLGRWVCRWGP